MQVLTKCQFYLMILFVAVLFAVGPVASDDQTTPSTGDAMQITKKPTIMILGSWHFTSSGLDGINTKTDNVLTPKRQREIEQVVEHLKEFKPTKIAVEVDPSRCDREIKNYQGYLNGTYELGPYEGDQIGYRLAKEFGHSRVYCVDYWPEHWPIPIDRELMDTSGFARTHNQEHLLQPPPTGKNVTRDADGKIWIEPEKYEPMIDKYIRINQPESRRADHQGYIRAARVGLGPEYPGANWLVHSWYSRNLKIFVNITRITESADDRILLIIGAGHVYLVQQFLENSGDYHLESPLKYLDAEKIQTP